MKKNIILQIVCLSFSLTLMARKVSDENQFRKVELSFITLNSFENQNLPEPLEKVKIAAVQISGYDKTVTPGLKVKAAENAVNYIEMAARDTAQLVVFPGYYLGRISVPGEETRIISEATAKNNIYVIIGSWEVIDDSTFYNAALLFDRSGKIIGKYYKTHAAVDKYEGNPAYSKPPSGHDMDWFLQNDPEWIMQRGMEFPVFDLDFARIGILTCYDGWFPEPFRILSLQGAEILVWINSRFGTVEDYIVRTAIWHNTVSMVCTNQAYGSGTMIADWPGNQIKAFCPEPKEEYISGYINLERLRNAREKSRNAQQRRPDIYNEILKEIP
jgi:predicted amidohydrolase